jgi:hypothetical protein
VSHTWTLLIWTFQAAFDVCAWLFITVLWLARRD